MPKSCNAYQADLEKFEELVEQGLTEREISKETGLSTGKVNQQKRLMRSFQALEEKKKQKNENKEEEKPIGDCDLCWSEIEEYLGMGFTIGETATAAGVSKTYLEELYANLPDKKFDCLETYAGILRVRRLKDFINAMEHRILAYGDLRAFHSLLKWRYSRFSFDTPKPPAWGRDT